MDDLKTKEFDFNVKPDFKELEASGKLFKYLMMLMWGKEQFESLIKKHSTLVIYGVNIHSDNIDKIDNLTKTEILNKYVSNSKLLKNYKEYLEITKKRQAELDEYLEI